MVWFSRDVFWAGILTSRHITLVNRNWCMTGFDDHSRMIMNFHDINLDWFFFKNIRDIWWQLAKVSWFLTSENFWWNMEPWNAMKDHEIYHKSKSISWLIAKFHESSWKLMEFICQFAPKVMKVRGLIQFFQQHSGIFILLRLSGIVRGKKWVISQLMHVLSNG